MSSNGFDLTPELEKYTHTKVASIAKLVPRRFRPSAHCQVYFSQRHKKNVKFNSCTVSLRLGETELKAEETTLHMYAALDIAAVHIEHQLRAYVVAQRKHPVRARLRERSGGEWLSGA